MPGFVTFLSKLGKALAEGVAIATGIWPLVSPFFGSASKVASTVPIVLNDLTSIGQIVVQAEALIQSPGSGAQKLAAATPLVVNIVKTSELVSGHKIANETLFIQGCADLTSAVAKILNSLDAGAVQQSGQPVTSIPAPQTVVVPTTTVTPAV
jgi:hypothetical protein